MAKRFIFRLEAVERLRRGARDQQRRAVSDAVRAVAGTLARIESLTEQLRQTVELTRGERQVEHLDVAALRGNQFYRNWLHRRILESNTELAGQQNQLEVERAKLGAASARLKVLEKLHERRRRRYREEVAHEEQSLADESAVQDYLRRASASSSLGRPC